MGVKLVSASAGSVEIVAPTTASNYTATLPAGTGTIVVNGINGSIVSGTSVASTSGTSIDFTSIPSWVKRITVMLNGVSTNGTSNLLVQIGAGSVTSTGYVSGAISAQSTTTSSAAITSTAGFLGTASINTAAGLQTGTITLLNITSTTWIASSLVTQTDGTRGAIGGGTLALGGTLDRVRLTTVNGTDTFDAGSVNILYE